MRSGDALALHRLPASGRCRNGLAFPMRCCEYVGCCIRGGVRAVWMHACKLLAVHEAEPMVDTTEQCGGYISSLIMQRGKSKEVTFMLVRLT